MATAPKFMVVQNSGILTQATSSLRGCKVKFPRILVHAQRPAFSSAPASGSNLFTKITCGPHLSVENLSPTRTTKLCMNDYDVLVSNLPDPEFTTSPRASMGQIQKELVNRNLSFPYRQVVMETLISLK